MTALSPVPVIAIDGPSASGKGTVAQIVAHTLGYHYLDSGALYRLAALAATTRGVDWDDEPALTALAGALDARFDAGEVWLDGRRVTEEIRTEACSIASSRVAAVPGVRAALLDRQRAFRQPPGLVADGRDMGSVLFPDARLKVFLTATLEARAERRYNQLNGKGIPANIQTLLLDLRERDARDAARVVAPLRAAADARMLDTTGMTADQAAHAVLSWFREAGK